MATQHYACTLLKKFGMLPWRRVVGTTQENMSRAALHHNRVLLKCCFHSCLDFTWVNEERLEAADTLCKNILLRRDSGDSGERLEELISVSTVYSTVFFHGFVEFVRTCQTAAILVSCDEHKQGKILNCFHFSELTAQGPYNQKRALIFF